MKTSFNVSGMTCTGCQAAVEFALDKLPEVDDIKVDLDEGIATVTSDQIVDLELINKTLPEKYVASEIEDLTKLSSQESDVPSQSKLTQLKPLFLILFYISVTSILLHLDSFSMSEVMLDFMGLFYIVFSFFKMLDLKGFPASFSMYDPLAKRIPIYGKIYPFLETALGLMFLFRFELVIALIATIIILGITTIGVVNSLLSKKTIRCACLGTVLNLPMTEATFIENAIMIIMAVGSLFYLI